MKGLSGAETLLRVLRAMGVERIFASPGSDWAPLWEALAKLHWPDVPEYLSTRHEETAVGMATGYAKASGKLPAVVLHTTVGALHATMGVRAALHERVPMVVLAGESIGFAEGTHSVMGRQWLRLLTDVGGPARLMEHCVKWSFGLNMSAILPHTVQRACQLAGALHGMRQDRAHVEAEAPFHAVLHEARRPADVGKQPQPLASHDRVRPFRKADRFAGQHYHRNALVQRGAHAHRGVKRAHRGVQHDRRELPARLGVSRGHANRGFFMARGKVFRNIRPMQLRKRLPERRPVRAGRGKYPLDAHRAQHAQEGFGSAKALHWPMPSSGISFA